MYEVSVSGHFDAAHALRGYRGKCENLHGHRFQVVVTLAAPSLNEIGIAYDFAELKEYLKAILQGLDHINLNETPPFDRLNPSSENLAATIFQELKARLPRDGATLTEVKVMESPDAWAVYRER